MELLLTKYTKALISYKGLSRIETYEYPEGALREALLNAVAHKDYAGSTPIQISVYADKIMFWNFGQLPENWTPEMLQKKHPSIPYNPDIANAFFRSGYVEAWGRGIEKINEQCVAAGLPLPLIYYGSSGCWVEFRKNTHSAEKLREMGLNERQIETVAYVRENGEVTTTEHMQRHNISERAARYDLTELVNRGLLVRSGGTNSSKFVFR